MTCTARDSDGDFLSGVFDLPLLSIVCICETDINRHVFSSHQRVIDLALDRWRWLATNLGGSSKRPPTCQRSARDCWIPSAMDLQDPASMVALFLVLSKDEDSRKMPGRRLSLEPTVSGVFISAYLSLSIFLVTRGTTCITPFFPSALGRREFSIILMISHQFDHQFSIFFPSTMPYKLGDTSANPSQSSLEAMDARIDASTNRGPPALMKRWSLVQGDSGAMKNIFVWFVL